MVRQPSLVLPAVLGLVAVAAGPLNAIQVPLGTVAASGQTVTPVFEGWYQNPDGTYTISFGYFSRNFEERVEIPVGPDNQVLPGAQNQGQPTTFEPRRHWGVFTVTVPAGFGDSTIVWTLKNRGGTFAIPASLHRDWQIDALEGEAGSGNTPPVVKFDEDGPVGAGPAGVTVGPLKTSVGNPLRITVWAQDDGRTSGSVARTGDTDVPVTLTWFKHQGPGAVIFGEVTAEVAHTGGSATTSVTFGAAGDYVLRVRANDASGVAGAGHAQCCWTNGFVRVTVTH